MQARVCSCSCSCSRRSVLPSHGCSGSAAKILQMSKCTQQTQAALLGYQRASRTPRADMDLLTMPPCCEMSAGTLASVILPGSCSRCSALGQLMQPLSEGQMHPKRKDVPPLPHHPLILIPRKTPRPASSSDLYSRDLLETVAFDILRKSLFSGHRLLHLPYCSPSSLCTALPCCSCHCKWHPLLHRCNFSLSVGVNPLIHRETSDFPSVSPKSPAYSISPWCRGGCCSFSCMGGLFSI